MKVSEIGEFGLIARLAKNGAKNPKIKMRLHFKQLLVGIGDDAAAYFPDNEIQLGHRRFSGTGMFHFSLSYMSWQEPRLEINRSESQRIAAMGGFPRYALVSLGLPPDTEVENVIDLYRGMFDIAGKFGLAIVGGDTVSSPFVFVSVTVIGSAGEKKRGMLRRFGGQTGR